MALDRKVLTVTELTKAIRGELESRFSEVWVEGEVSNYHAAQSGHVYFTLKDAGAQLKAVLFKHSRAGLRFGLQDGMQVLAHGRLSVYDVRGEYQLILDRMEPQGLGALQAAFDQLKKKLQAEGLFEAGRKRPIPAYPRSVGLVTSPGGAVLHDILNVTARRCPWVDLLLFPVKVQGEGSAAEIKAAVEAAQEFEGELDLLVVARGGGSLEDLWSFNEEEVARAIAASRIPVISAVGHETDFTIADFVADLRAPTPSAAAELLSEGRQEVQAELRRRVESLSSAVGRHLEGLASEGSDLSRRLLAADPRAFLEQCLQRLDDQDHRLATAWKGLMGSWDQKLKGLSGRLDALSPLAILGRGYAAVFTLPGKKLVKKASEAPAGTLLEVVLGQGALKAKVVEGGAGG